MQRHEAASTTFLSSQIRFRRCSLSKQSERDVNLMYGGVTRSEPTAPTFKGLEQPRILYYVNFHVIFSVGVRRPDFVTRVVSR